MPVSVVAGLPQGAALASGRPVRPKIVGWAWARRRCRGQPQSLGRARPTSGVTPARASRRAPRRLWGRRPSKMCD